jgi:hypothetical protein
MKWQSLEVAEKYSARVLSSSVVGDCFNMKWQSIEIAEKYSARVLSSSVVSDCFNMKWQSLEVALQGRIQDFKLWGGEHLKKLRRAEGGANIFGVFRVKNHDFMPKNHIFSNFRGVACQVNPSHLESTPDIYSETCQSRTSLEPTFVFGIDKCSVYTS